MSTAYNKMTLRFPLWAYLTQPIFGAAFKSFRPRRFWYLYSLERLEIAWVNSPEPNPEEVNSLLEFLDACWADADWRTDPRLNREFVHYLERCWLKQMSRSKGMSNASDPQSDEETFF
ncbi:hypothetical protein [Thermocoleostomius sinensis]|uniref:Uncharacterized protein n=1 Tax=Thermocoleostomius sinensis A174 TaxID=2016057 RepID=A0A9E8ZJ75_9CYAN|nr:hypothetical protein [Thermocoleostomius sinensis]WAL62714.1 hypothetical protein OXH18_12190 [Thermocoleostomius sinensis A174]